MGDKINELLNDSAFQAKLDKAQTEEEITALFGEKDIKVNFDYENSDGELSEQSLENVAGGRIIFNPWIWKRIGRKIVKCILIA